MSAFSYNGGGSFMREQTKHLPLSETVLWCKSVKHIQHGGTSCFVNFQKGNVFLWLTRMIWRNWMSSGYFKMSCFWFLRIKCCSVHS
jgi:hypothetical protein